MQVLAELESFVQGFIKHHYVRSLLQHLLDKKSVARIHKYEGVCTLEAWLYKTWPPFHCWESEKLICVSTQVFVQLLALLPHRVQLQAGASMFEWVPSGYSGKCPQSKDLHARLIGR